jgi:hypothetical protein
MTFRLERLKGRDHKEELGIDGIRLNAMASEILDFICLAQDKH